MGTTGSSIHGQLNAALPDILRSIRQHTTIPLAVGFGIATRRHFEVAAEAGADGVVIGSRLVTIIKESSKELLAKTVEAYCREISLKGQLNAHTYPGNGICVRPQLDFSVLPSRFGEFGGQFVPESLMHCLGELEQVHKSAMNDPGFWQEFRSFYGYMNRPSKLYRADKLSEQTGGATIWLKREDLYVSTIDGHSTTLKPSLCIAAILDLIRSTTSSANCSLLAVWARHVSSQKQAVVSTV